LPPSAAFELGLDRCQHGKRAAEAVTGKPDSLIVIPEIPHDPDEVLPERDRRREEPAPDIRGGREKHGLDIESFHDELPEQQDRQAKDRRHYEITQPETQR